MSSISLDKLLSNDTIIEDKITIIAFITFARLLLVLFILVIISLFKSKDDDEKFINISMSQGKNKNKNIIIIRHGEKPEPDTGVLNCLGFNRAIQLAPLFTKKYPKPERIYTVKPDIHEDGTLSKARPLMTIEPYAIMNNIPINIEYTYEKDDLKKLAKELYDAAPGYYIICWEHKNIKPLVDNILSEYKNKTIKVPEWDGKDFDTIYDIFYNDSMNEL